MSQRRIFEERLREPARRDRVSERLGFLSVLEPVDFVAPRLGLGRNAREIINTLRLPESNGSGSETKRSEKNQEAGEKKATSEISRHGK